jgi:signal transduction histidine kinase
MNPSTQAIIPGRGAFRLLLVEDNPGDAELARERLADSPEYAFEIMHVTRLSDAIDTLEKTRVDAAILDLNLPDSTGIETLRRLHDFRPDVAIVVLSGEATEELRQVALHEGAQDFLSKNEPASRLVARTFVYALERHRAEVQRRQVETVFAANPDAIIVTDTNGVVQLVNDAAVDFFDRPRESFVGSYLGFPMTIGGASAIAFERRGVKKSADMRVAEFEWDRKPAYLASVRDTTEQRKLNEQLRQSQKMEAVGLLAGGIAHDFNNILLVIMTYADLIHSQLEDNDSRRLDASEIISAVERAQLLTRQLLDFSRRQPTQPRLVDLNDVIDGVHRMLRRTLPTNIEVSVASREGAWPVFIDPRELEQALMNLVLNARDAMPNGGRLNIKVENVTVDRAREGLRPGPYVSLSVSDTGWGILPENLERIFEPFFTTKEIGKGTGLGLSICYGIARQSGGDIRVQSTLGVGTTFTLMLPRAVGVPERRTADHEAPETLEGTETILVVEDNPSVLRSTARILSKRGYKVLEASNGDQALRLIQQHGRAVDLVLTDVMMPHMTGTELAERLDVSHPNLKVIFTSGYTDEALGDDNVLDTDRAVLFKPYPPRELLTRIRRELDADGVVPAAGRWKSA